MGSHGENKEDSFKPKGKTAKMTGCAFLKEKNKRQALYGVNSSARIFTHI